MTSALIRYGAMLVAPRRTVAAVPDDEGDRDGLWMALMFVAAVGVYALVEGAADFAATRNFNGLLMLLSALGRALVVPIVALVAAETILGPTRAHRRGLCLVPMVLAALLLRHLPMAAWIRWPYVDDVIVIAIAIAMAFWIRPSVVPRKEPVA